MKSKNRLENNYLPGNVVVHHVVPPRLLIGVMLGAKISHYVMHVAFAMLNLKKDVHYVTMFHAKRIKTADVARNAEEVGYEITSFTLHIHSSI